MWLSLILRFVLVVLVQLAILNHLHLSLYIHPVFYLFFVIKMPLSLPKWVQLLMGFSLGLTLDIFEGSPGIHSAAAVFIAFVRPYLASFLSPGRDMGPAPEPSVNQFGMQWFATFSFVLLLLHHFSLYFLEEFSFAGFFSSILRMILSTLFSLLLVLLTEYLLYRPRN